MSDFLTSLLARNTLIGPSAETLPEERLSPRPRSRFEQLPMSEQPGGLDLDSGGDVPTRPRAELPFRPPAPSAAFADWPALDRADDLSTLGQRSVLGASEQREMFSAPSPTAPLLDERGSNQPQPAAHRPVDGVERLTSSAEKRILQEDVPRYVHRGRLDATANRTQPWVRPEPEAEDRQNRDAHPEAGRLSPVMSTQRAIQPLPRQTELIHPAHLVEQPAAPAVIHVSIGRVEVRAVQANAAPSQRQGRKPSPVVSLEEFLQRRSGSER